MQLIVYTAIFGQIGDKLRPPQNTSSDVAYIAYLDVEEVPEVEGWEVRRPAWHHPDARRKARKHKLLSHRLYPEADYTLWLDGCFTPVVDPWELVDRYLQDSDLCVFRHAQRKCVYQEVEACVRLRKDDPRVMRAQISRYRREGYPYHNGLAETGALLRRHTEKIREFNEAWWRELSQNSLRDQLSFDYVCWRHRIRYSVFDGDRHHTPYFHWRPHR